MRKHTSNRSLEFSLRVYQRLLAAYPQSHREQYGAAMIQLFRDQCRDAWEVRQTWGLLALWLRILPDLFKTSLIERLATLNPGKFISNKMNALFNSLHSPLVNFFSVFALVFVLVFGAAVTITFLTPKSYRSVAQIIVSMQLSNADVSRVDEVLAAIPDRVRAVLETTKSPQVLGKIANRLNLNQNWGKQSGSGGPLTTVEVIEMLKRRLDLNVLPKTTIIMVNAYGPDPKENAELANAVAEFWSDKHNAAGPITFYEHARATPSLVSPNRKRNYFMGAIVGVMLGTLAGLISLSRIRRARMLPYKTIEGAGLENI